MAQPLRVLIVEDLDDDAVLVVRQLTRSGYDVTYQRVDTEAAMRDALRDKTFDLVITDHNMPRFDSTRALAVLKESGIDVPFILVSGSVGEDVAVAAMKSGAHDYLMKGTLARLGPAVQRELREAEERRARRKAEEAVRHMAYHDPLTGLPNRRLFEQRVEHALAGVASRRAVHAMLYLDLDQFKVVNDTAGHLAGDALLRQAGELLRETVRDTDTVARLGGDEFGVLLEDCAMEKALQVAGNVRDRIAHSRFVWEGQQFHIGVSAGIVALSEHMSVHDALVAADLACYAAKDSGRNRIHVYQSGDAELAQRHLEMRWVQRLHDALEKDQFVLYAQPIVPLRGVAAEPIYEILLRLRDEGGSIVAPAAFLPAAERYKLMPAVDRWVVKQALSWMAGGSCIGMCSINLSGASLSDTTLLDFILTEASRRSVPLHRLCFEVTETAAIAHMSRAAEFIRAGREAGLRFALDDFGTGLSSFSYLKALPVDFLKIDGSFIKDMGHDPMSSAIVTAIFQIGQAAGMQTVAECVEDEYTQRRLAQLGVDFAQGYVIAHPAPLTELVGQRPAGQATGEQAQPVSETQARAGESAAGTP